MVLDPHSPPLLEPNLPEQHDEGGLNLRVEGERLSLDIDRNRKMHIRTSLEVVGVVSSKVTETIVLHDVDRVSYRCFLRSRLLKPLKSPIGKLVAYVFLEEIFRPLSEFGGLLEVLTNVVILLIVYSSPHVLSLEINPLVPPLEDLSVKYPQRIRLHDRSNNIVQMLEQSVNNFYELPGQSPPVYVSLKPIPQLPMKINILRTPKMLMYDDLSYLMLGQRFVTSGCPERRPSKLRPTTDEQSMETRPLVCKNLLNDIERNEVLDLNILREFGHPSIVHPSPDSPLLIPTSTLRELDYHLILLLLLEPLKIDQKILLLPERCLSLRIRT